MNPWRVQVDTLRDLLELAEVGDIARRYAAMNAFDGILTIMGVLVGSFTARVTDPHVVVTTGLATSVAVGISGLWGAYLTETAERKRSLDEMEHLTLSDLGATRLGRASRLAAVAVALIDGVSPFLASVIVLTPFLAVALLPNPLYAYYLALGAALALLFGLGTFLGTISKDRLIVSGIKTLTAGLVCVAINLLLGAG